MSAGQQLQYSAASTSAAAAPSQQEQLQLGTNIYLQSLAIARSGLC